KRSETGKMGAGAMIGYSPSLSREVSHALRNAAEAEEIPWQYEVMNGTTGTNADRFSVCREGVKACTVSIPLRYMHTPQEVIDIADVELTGKLLAAYLRRCGA
ncbi:MAG: M42 family peptidase, partial [Oscillospiraceae bacterium]|nr:M42 family peptidase [Oscillospiraceae bacterium]